MLIFKGFLVYKFRGISKLFVNKFLATSPEKHMWLSYEIWKFLDFLNLFTAVYMSVWNIQILGVIPKKTLASLIVRSYF